MKNITLLLLTIWIIASFLGDISDHKKFDNIEKRLDSIEYRLDSMQKINIIK